MTETESSQYPLTYSSLLSSSSSSLPPPPQYPNSESYIGSFVNLVTNYGLRYSGLQNVICYDTERRNNNGSQIPPCNVVYNYFVLQKIRVTPPSSFTSCGYYYGYASLAREATIIKPSPHATKPPPPLIFSPYNQNDGAKIRQNVPLLISNVEELSEPQATTDDSDAFPVKGSVNDGLQIAWNHLALPKYPGSDFYDPWVNHVYQYLPCDALYQDPTNAASELVFAPQSFFTTFPPGPISLRLIDGGLDIKALTKNIKHYELWAGPQGDNNNQGDPNTIDGSFYMISRNPFDPIGRPCNPFGSVERPFPHFPSSCELADLGFV